MGKNKNLFAIIGGLLLITVFVLSFTLGGDKKEASLNSEEEDVLIIAKKESNMIDEKEKKAFTNISVEDYLKKYLGEEKSIVLVGRSDCMYCVIAEPLIQNIMYKYDFNVNYLSTDDFTIETESQFMESNEILNSFATPLLMVVSNGSIIDYTDELHDTDGYLDFFVNNGII